MSVIVILLVVAVVAYFVLPYFKKSPAPRPVDHIVSEITGTIDALNLSGDLHRATAVAHEEAVKIAQAASEKFHAEADRARRIASKLHEIVN